MKFWPTNRLPLVFSLITSLGPLFNWEPLEKCSFVFIRPFSAEKFIKLVDTNPNLTENVLNGLQTIVESLFYP